MSGDLLEQLDNEARIELEGEATLYSRILAGERAWSLASLREQERPWYFLPLKPVDASLYLEGMEREVQWAQEGTSVPPKGSVDLSWLPAAIANELTGASAASTARNARLRSIAQLRCLRVLIALARRRAASEPEQPRIDALGINAEDIRDPFSRTGESLKLLRREGAWVIYSIGENQLDDGGSLDYLDIGIGVPELP